jgi:hypothetical protein
MSTTWRILTGIDRQTAVRRLTRTILPGRASRVRRRDHGRTALISGGKIISFRLIP